MATTFIPPEPIRSEPPVTENNTALPESPGCSCALLQNTDPNIMDNLRTVLMKILVAWRTCYGITSSRTEPTVNDNTKSLKYKWLLAILGG